MFNPRQQHQFLRVRVGVFGLETPIPRNVVFLHATRPDLAAARDDHTASMTRIGTAADLDDRRWQQWLDQVLPWLQPLFASETETVRELLERLDPDVLAQHLGFDNAAAREASWPDRLYEEGVRLGLDADFWPVEGRTDLALVIDNRGGPCGYVVPARRVFEWLYDLDDEATDRETVWEGLAAFAACVDITARPGDVKLGH